MKHLKHPATILAALALFVALASGAYASGLISGSQIKNHSIAAKKLTKSAVKSLQGAPGGNVLTYDTTATSSSPSPVSLGTVLGDTFSTTCATNGGAAGMDIKLDSTTDGSLGWDFGTLDDTNGTVTPYDSSFDGGPGSLTSPLDLGSVDAAAGGKESDGHVEIVQFAPQGGYIILHVHVSTIPVTPTCHLSIQYVPEKTSALAAAPRKAPAKLAGHRLLLFGTR